MIGHTASQECAQPLLCIAIHDVAPATWPACERLLAMLEGLGAPPLTLLVVPDYHARGRIDADPAFVRAIDRRIARGDEVALHGFHHRDDSAAPRALLPWLRRRVLTAGEGEFAAIDEPEADARIAMGMAIFARLGWQARGFVAPAWLLGAAARGALEKTSLQWTSTHTHLLHLKDNRERVAAPCITASPRSAWRREVSRAWIGVAPALLRGQRVVRVGLHPADAAHAALCRRWERSLRTLLQTRTPLTKSAALRRLAGEAKALTDASAHASH